MILAAKEVPDGLHQGVPRHGGVYTRRHPRRDGRPRLHARLRGLAALAWAHRVDAAILAGSFLLWEVLIWIAWGLWAVTR